MNRVTKKGTSVLLVCAMTVGMTACQSETATAPETSTEANVSAEVAVDGKEGVDTITVNGTPVVYVTTPDEMYKYVRQSEDAVKVYDASELDDTTGWVIPVDPDAKMQTIDGWGSSLTDASAINLSMLSEEERSEVLHNLFDKDTGIGLNMLRQPLGCSDFSVEYGSYDEVDGDEDLSHFSIDYDKQYIIPYIKEALEIGDDMTVISSVWTPPLWMKTIPEYWSKNGSSLKRENYQLFSDYIVKALQAYEDEGVHISYLSPQNEPSARMTIPSCLYDTDSYSTLINRYLKPTMEANGITTGLIGWDFNHFDPALDFISSTYDNIDIIAFHLYYQNWDMQKEFHQYFPDKPIWMTESSNRQVSGYTTYIGEMKRIATSLRSYASAYFIFNIMLDEEGGPGQAIDFSNPAGLIQYNRETGQVSYQIDFYALGHYSKFIRKGAVILDTVDTGADNEGNIQNIVALNENGAMTAVLTNGDTEAQTFKFVVGDKVVEYTVPARSGATITWDANTY